MHARANTYIVIKFILREINVTVVVILFFVLKRFNFFRLKKFGSWFLISTLKTKEPRTYLCCDNLRNVFLKCEPLTTYMQVFYFSESVSHADVLIFKNPSSQ